MTNNQIFSAYIAFWNSFVDTLGRPALSGAPARPPNMPIPAFQEGFVQVRVGNAWQAPPFPYIVYPVANTAFANSNLLAVSIWDRVPNMPGNFSMVNDVVDQINERIPHSGVVLRLDKGLIMLRRGNPWYIPMGDESDPAIVRGLLNIEVSNFIV